MAVQDITQFELSVPSSLPSPVLTGGTFSDPSGVLVSCDDGGDSSLLHDSVVLSSTVAPPSSDPSPAAVSLAPGTHNPESIHFFNHISACRGSIDTKTSWSIWMSFESKHCCSSSGSS